MNNALVCELCEDIRSCGLERVPTEMENLIRDVKIKKGMINGFIEDYEAKSEYPENMQYLYDIQPYKNIVDEFLIFIDQLEANKFNYEDAQTRFNELKQKKEDLYEKCKYVNPDYEPRTQAKENILKDWFERMKEEYNIGKPD